MGAIYSTKMSRFENVVETNADRDLDRSRSIPHSNREK